MYDSSSKLFQAMDAAIRGLGYELLGIEMLRDANGNIVRLYIDKADGVGIKDCETVSRHVSGVLDVEDLIAGQYTLEVSSPGLDRPLFTPAHYKKYVGSVVKLRLNRMLEGRRRVKATLESASDEAITVVDEQQLSMTIPFDMIDKGQLVPTDI